jgi:putative transposase
LASARARRATRFEALEPLRQYVTACFGVFDGVTGGLKLRHVRGGHYVADDFPRQLAFRASRTRPPSCASPTATAVSSGSSPKENLLWLHRLATAEELRLALHAFKDTYNRTWVVERHGDQTRRPSERSSLRRSAPPYESTAWCLATVDMA